MDRIKHFAGGIFWAVVEGIGSMFASIVLSIRLAVTRILSNTGTEFFISSMILTLPRLMYPEMVGERGKR